MEKVNDVHFLKALSERWQNEIDECADQISEFYFSDSRKEVAGAVAIECPPGSVAMWDGNLWHSNYPRSLDGG